jgi:hypothetical protein
LHDRFNPPQMMAAMPSRASSTVAAQVSLKTFITGAMTSPLLTTDFLLNL